MPNPVQAAAEGLPKITRRSALAVTGAGLTAALAGVQSSVAAEPEHPWEAARRLGRELSDVLAMDIGDGIGPGGDWYAEIQPASGQRYTVMFGSISAREWPKRNVTLPLQTLIDNHRKAREDFCKACDGVDRIALGREPSKAAQRRYDKANRAEHDALVAVCAFKAYGDADARAKAKYLMPYVKGGELYEHHIAALINSGVRS